MWWFTVLRAFGVFKIGPRAAIQGSRLGVRYHIFVESVTVRSSTEKATGRAALVHQLEEVGTKITSSGWLS